MSNLKPCPFCGTVDSLKIFHTNSSDRVWCKKCDAQAPLCLWGNSCLNNSILDLVESVLIDESSSEKSKRIAGKLKLLGVLRDY